MGLGSAFLAVFMLKALFFVRHGEGDDGLEVTPADQPELFAFLHKLADRAGAPRPHRVFLSARVNAAVFYDLSLLNLVFPSRKNLEIGLGLVNALTLGELRAVLAHEFGHFAQRSMAVGRWVYVAQQIAGHLVARRDKLDDFLAALSRFDIRLAWVGWLLNLIVWSIRSLVDSAFQLVLLMQRALSREMEMNADLVAVSLTGSDALIHALHRLQAADDAWSRAVNFTFGEKQQGRRVRDLFAVQTHLVGHMGRLLNDSTYGQVPPAGADPKTHRVFKADLAQPPRMWLTHPLNHEREANAKRHYVAAPVDNRSAWELFTGTQTLREDVTARLLGDGEMPEDADAFATLDRQFDREHLNRRYRGVYFGRSAVRWAATLPELHEPAPQPSALAFDSLYPASLAADMERLRSLERELEQLNAVQSGTLKASGGVIRHRGRTIKRARLTAAIGEVEYELADANKRLQAHDRRCRSLHRAAAVTFGDGWPEYLDGLLAALHHAEHTEAHLRDLQGVLGNSVAIVTATRRVSKAGVARVIAASEALWRALHQVHDGASAVSLDASLLGRLKATAWTDMLGTCDLGQPVRENINDWLKVVDSWVDHVAHLCGAVRVHALEQLLQTEAELAGHVRAGTRPDAAPAPSKLPAAYPLLVPGQERPRQTRLGAWGRFQTADGVVAGGARLAVAGGIVAAVLGFGFSVGTGSLMIYNGLSRPVNVRVGDAPEVTVPAFGHMGQTIGSADAVRITTTTTDGREIEHFDADTHARFGQFVYNVAGAGSLVEWTAVYGNTAPVPDRPLGAPRWLTTGADLLFEDAPADQHQGGRRLTPRAVQHDRRVAAEATGPVARRPRTHSRAHRSCALGPARLGSRRPVAVGGARIAGPRAGAGRTDRRNARRRDVAAGRTGFGTAGTASGRVRGPPGPRRQPPGQRRLAVPAVPLPRQRGRTGPPPSRGPAGPSETPVVRVRRRQRRGLPRPLDRGARDPRGRPHRHPGLPDARGPGDGAHPAVAGPHPRARVRSPDGGQPAVEGATPDGDGPRDRRRRARGLRRPRPRALRRRARPGAPVARGHGPHAAAGGRLGRGRRCHPRPRARARRGAGPGREHRLAHPRPRAARPARLVRA